VGEFREGNDWNTKEYDKDGNIIRKWVNGKVIKP
jgi:protein associated with RNAse G/E